MKRMTFDRELLKGSIALLILKLLSERDMYGYEIIHEAARRSSDAFQFKEGTCIRLCTSCISEAIFDRNGVPVRLVASENITA